MTEENRIKCYLLGLKLVRYVNRANTVCREDGKFLRRNKFYQGTTTPPDKMYFFDEDEAVEQAIKWIKEDDHWY